MTWGHLVRGLRRSLVAMLLLLAVAPVSLRAETVVIGGGQGSSASCLASASPTESLARIAADTARWNCGETVGYSVDRQQLVLRFDLSDQQIEKPGLLINSHTYRETDQFSRFQIASLGTGEIATSEWLTIQQLNPSSPVWRTRVTAPSLKGEVEAIYVRIDQPSGAIVAERFELEDAAPAALLVNRDQLIAAVLCGLLLAPALFGLGYFRVLRTRFPLYHALFCLLAVTQVATLAGLLPLMIDLTREAQFVILHMSFDLLVAASTIFAASFIEPDKIGARSRRLLYGLTALAMALGIMRVTFGQSIGMPVAFAYYAGYAVFLVGLATALYHPLRCGSRATWFVLVSYLPLAIIGAARVVLALGTDFGVLFHAVLAQHFALSWQVVVSAFAVADRFMVIRRERDRARTAATLMERASERDALTGLYNRRIIAERYDSLRASGYTSLALIDLDHFKRINDSYGHAVGDRVLCAVAEALKPEKDTIAIRMGGEEFALLMRGRGIFERAEHRRKAITAAAREALGNDHSLTASMGLVELKSDAKPGLDFSSLYERADRLLYEAKNAGRDRTISESVKIFHTRENGNRRARQDRRDAA